MPTTVGPNTFGEENLVFGYDLGDVSNSYKGEPTTNSALTDMTAFTKDNGCTVTATGEYYQGQPVYRVYFPSGTLPRIRFNFAYTTGQQWNGSIYYKVVQSGDYMPNFIFRESGFGTTYTSVSFNTDGNWRRANLNYTFSSNGTCMFLLYRSNSSSTQPVYIDFAMPQVEAGKTHATQFTTGTRSATQGLVDLTGNSTIDLTNVSFDSNAQMTFDGTNDRISIPAGAFPTIGTEDFTLEFVCKNTKTSSYNHFFCVNDQYHFAFKASNTSGILYVYRTSALSTTNTVSAYISSRTEYYHIVAKRDGDNIEIFINGISQGTKSGWGSISIDNNLYTSYIGWGNASEYTGGDIPVAKIYNRALTASEIKANYNAVKSRFNI